MENKRRSFLKKVAVAGTVVAAGSAVAVAATTKTATPVDNNGVVVGKSNKKEILYKKTQAWNDFYKSAK